MKDFFECIWFYVSDFFKNFVYPAYYVRNFFFKRYDIVKLPEIKRWHYSDNSYRMQCAVMELVCNFVEEEEKNQIVDWNDPSADMPDGRNSWKIMKEIRDWWRNTRNEKERICSEFLDFYCKYTIGNLRDTKEDENGYVCCEFICEYEFNSLEDVENIIPESDLRKFDAVCDDRTAILDKARMRELMDQCEREIEDTDDKMMYNAISVWRYLWT